MSDVAHANAAQGGSEPTEPWNDVREETNAATFGMWLFLGTELLFFGGLFLAYTVTWVTHPKGFVEAARKTDIWFGTVNTVVLFTSALMMAMAVRGAETGSRSLAWRALASTAALGAIFLIIEGFEFSKNVDQNLVPGPAFPINEQGAEIFFSLYWIMTVLHAIHLIIGVILVARFALLMRSAPLDIPDLPAYGLYWQFVTTIWIVFYPLLYLIGRAP